MFQLLTKNGRTALWYAASEGHNSVLYYLLREKHDSYSLLEDRRVSNLGYCHQNSFDRQIVPMATATSWISSLLISEQIAALCKAIRSY